MIVSCLDIVYMKRRQAQSDVCSVGVLNRWRRSENVAVRFLFACGAGGSSVPHGHQTKKPFV